MMNKGDITSSSITLDKMGTGHSSIAETNNSSLALLEAIVDVGLTPEKFSDICYDWAQRPSDVERLKGFNTFLNIAYLQNRSHFNALRADDFTGHRQFSNDIRSNTILIDTTLKVVSVGPKASEILGVVLGDSVNELFEIDVHKIIEAANSETQKKVMGDILSQNGSRHIASVIKISGSGKEEPLYRFTLLKISLPIEAEDYIRKTLSLTNAEIEILKLILERLSIASISDIRKCSLNTTRTHINNIKNKFKSHSLTDVILSTHEIIALHYQKRDPLSDYRDKYIPIQRNSTLSKLTASPNQVEYSRYGDPEGRPLVILHSLEYGIAPPKDFVTQATEAGYCVYIPLRSGFGRTSPASSTRAAAAILNDYISTLKLTNITVIALSTAAPTAIRLIEISHRIESVVFVNYAFNTKEKISHIKPVWLRGLLQFTLGSDESFKFAFRMSKSMLRIIGFKTFYRKIYQSCKEDLVYLEDNLESFKSAANLILSSKAESCRNDLVGAFLPNPIVERLLPLKVNAISIFGENTHGISLDPIKEATIKLGIPFHVLAKSGRNCVYQNPEEFFKILTREDALKKAI